MEEPSATRPKPEALTLNKSSAKIAKKSTPNQIRSPVIVYVKSPEVIKARPEEFMELVQRLTGKEHGAAGLSDSATSSDDGDDVGRSRRDEKEREEFGGGKADSSSFGAYAVRPNWHDFGLTL